VNWILLTVGLIFILFLLLLGLEVGARWFLRRRKLYYVWPPYLRLELHPDPKVFPELERKVRIEINSHGERGSEPPASSNGLYYILVAGGSPAECGLLDQPTSWPGALERILTKPEHLRILGASRVHVGNIARSGIASAHLNLIFQKVLPECRRLSAIIVMVGGNDVWDWLQRGAPAVYIPSPAPITQAFSICPERQFRRMITVPALRQFMNEIRRNWSHPVKFRQHSGKWVGDARTMRACSKEIRNSVTDPKDMLANFERNFKELLNAAKAHADRVLVVRQPWFEKNHYTPEEVSHLWSGGMGDPSTGEDVKVFYSLEVCSQLMRLIDLRAAKIADELGIQHLNLMPALEPSLKTFYDFIHFTPAGAAAVAEAVAKILVQPHPKKTDGRRIPLRPSPYRTPKSLGGLVRRPAYGGVGRGKGHDME
jgi:lysophospholipase L1-like esterase